MGGNRFDREDPDPRDRMDTIYQWLVLNVFYPAQAAVIAVSAGVDREAAFVAATASMKTKTRQVHVLWPRRVVERAQNVGIRRVFCTPISIRLQTFNSMRVGAPCCQRSIVPRDIAIWRAGRDSNSRPRGGCAGLVSDHQPSAAQDRFAVEIPQMEKRCGGLDATVRLWMILDVIRTSSVSHSTSNLSLRLAGSARLFFYR